jgi:hypothetical protein
LLGVVDMEPLQERLAGFLHERRGETFCLDCLSAEFNVPHAEMREIASAVALVVADVKYAPRCSRCGARSGWNSIVGADAA